ncbi:MAG: DUF1844 domain-containing protein [Acidobacteria bacterium]|nr:DUF1844 domain-containing protein [Acidobacteriota bacterium]
MSDAVPEPSLSALVHLLAEQALLALGVPHPQLPQQPPADPRVARFYIDLLDVLREKTEGNRSAEESRELEEILHGLRLRALNLVPAAPSAKT